MRARHIGPLSLVIACGCSPSTAPDAVEGNQPEIQTAPLRPPAETIRNLPIPSAPAELPPPRGFCSADGWCWENPLPQGNGLADVWSRSPADVWAIGSYGTVLRWNGTIWQSLEVRTREELRAVHGTGPDDVWIAGRTSAMHWDGSSWRHHELPRNRRSCPPHSRCRDYTPSVQDLWSGRGGTWVVAQEGAIFHWTGSEWVDEKTPTDRLDSIDAVWGDDRGGVFAATYEGDVLRRRAGRWRRWYRTPARDRPHPIASLDGAGGHLWALRAPLLRWNGSVWSSVKLPAAAGAESPRALGNPPIEQTFADGDMFGIWAESRRAAWQVGLGGQIDRWDGRSWRGEVPARARELSLVAIDGQGANDVWAVGWYGRIVHRDARGWNQVTIGPPTLLAGTWSSSPCDAWAVGEGGTILHGDCRTWSPVASGTTRLLHAVHGSRSDDVWAVGEAGALLHWDGRSWTPAARGPSGDLLDVWSDGRETWVVAAGGAVWRGSTGGAWQRLVDGQSDVYSDKSLHAIWASSSTDVWIVGHRGHCLHWDGNRFASRPIIGRPDWVGGIWGSGHGEPWVTSHGSVWRWNGAAWDRSRVDDVTLLYAIHGASAREVRVVGESGRVFRWDGARWRREESGTNLALLATAGDLAVGQGGAIVRRRSPARALRSWTPSGARP
jgi:hypothetical protein